ncbi:MAG: hypothetical protein Q9162_006001 [Coniocarpon cinnabarinum]
MNNADFNSLLTTDVTESSVSRGAGSRHHGPTLASRGGSSSILKPRSIKGRASHTFPSQLSTEDRDGQPSSKRFKSSSVKGTKLAKGYHDRAQERYAAAQEEDPTAKRVKALEEQMKLGKIERITFEKLRNEITGGNVGATHLVKGLDWKLLERVRKGENVLDGNSEAKTTDDAVGGADSGDAANEDEAFDDLEKAEVAPVKRDAVAKKGQLTVPTPEQSTTGNKRSRNELLAEFQANRKAQEEARAAANREGWKKDLMPGSSRLERDAKGREVLITVNEDGTIKRKVRKTPAPPATPVVQLDSAHDPDLDKPPTTSHEASPKLKKSGPRRRNEPLGVDATYTAIIDRENAEAGNISSLDQESDDDDIFEGVGGDYDPLAGLEDDEASSDKQAPQAEPSKGPGEAKQVPSLVVNESGDNEDAGLTHQSNAKEAHDSTASHTEKPVSKRNYFSVSDQDANADSRDSDAKYRNSELLAALKRAFEISKREELAQDAASSKPREGSSAAERLLNRRDRDYDDIDFGFGASRGDDEDDAGVNPRVKLSEWKGIQAKHNDESNGVGRGGQSQRKRGNKKKKADKDNAGDVLRVLEGKKSRS